MKRVGVACLVVSMLCFVPAAGAQDLPSWNGGWFSSSTTTTTTVAGIGGIVLLIMMLTKKDDKPSDDAVRATELYLRQNSLQLAQDLATGRGPAVQELADAMDLTSPNAQLLGELLRTDRSALLDLADVERLDPARALAFATRLQGLMSSEPSLRAELERMSAVYGN